eukprot:TRINITY_DN10737_c0_g2_i6.p1 TRINITY_DN10737_c0_g2~~TRINITY_DN10737_c0_g2_i6.p1  ORF type:complete len:206 (+),score=45.82 TRINITY_DN10737_c0_g2_i6:208-825(+)
MGRLLGQVRHGYCKTCPLGYILSNGVAGVIFNDNTKIVQYYDDTLFFYITRHSKDSEEISNVYNFHNYPEELRKKVTLMTIFKSYLEKGGKETEIVGHKKKLVYVRRWRRTNHSVFFELSNGVVQATFEDKTGIIIDKENKMVSYYNKKREFISYDLATAIDSENPEMIKRLLYTKKVLTKHSEKNAKVPLTEEKPATPPKADPQ